MGKKILRVYLAKNDTPYSAAYAKLELPASPWEVWDALDKVRLQTDDILYMEIEDYFAFEYLSPHLDGLDISLNELNDLAAIGSNPLSLITRSVPGYGKINDSSADRVFGFD